MKQEEKRSGNLTNNQVEQDLKARGKTPETNNTYTGAQDTGDEGLREQGTAVQQAGGRPPATENGDV